MRFDANGLVVAGVVYVLYNELLVKRAAHAWFEYEVNGFGLMRERNRANKKKRITQLLL